ncbi:MAG: SRPBCC family protein [Myxococcota bacterium]
MGDRIEKQIELKAPIDRVWRALTDHEEFGAWFRVKLDGPFAVGEVTTGRITYEGYENMKWRSRVEFMEAPHRFVFTWPNPEDPTDEQELASAPETRVEFRLEEIPGGTRLTVIESGFEMLPAGRRATAMRENDGGWDIQTAHIKAHVEK